MRIHAIPSSSSSYTCVSQVSLRVVRDKIQPDPVLAQSSGHVDDDMQFFSVDASCEMDGRESRYIKEVLAWYREEDTGDLKTSLVSCFGLVRARDT